MFRTWRMWNQGVVPLLGQIGANSRVRVRLHCCGLVHLAELEVEGQALELSWTAFYGYERKLQDLRNQTASPVLATMLKRAFCNV